jgi:hypothetical protein
VPFFFEFKLLEYGWADAVLGDEKAWVDLTASHVSDALGDLVRAARNSLVANEAECSWDAEPEEFRWIFWREGENTRLTVLTLDDAMAKLPRESGRVIFETIASAIEVARVIERGARDVLEKFGTDGYRKRWWTFPFPSDNLDQLHAVIKNER